MKLRARQWFRPWLLTLSSVLAFYLRFEAKNYSYFIQISLSHPQKCILFICVASQSQEYFLGDNCVCKLWIVGQ